MGNLPTRRIKTVTIANGASLSGVLNLGDYAAVRIDMPAAWTAANLTFQVSPDGVTYQNLYDATGAEYTVTAAVSTNIILSAADFLSVQWLKIRSGTSGSPVNQGAARILTVTQNYIV